MSLTASPIGSVVHERSVIVWSLAGSLFIAVSGALLTLFG